MTVDFRASQIQTNKIIASTDISGTSTNAKLLIYPISSQGSPSNTGIIDTAKFNIASIGTDVFLFVSGGVGSRGTSTGEISVFGGDLHISGNLSVGGTIPALSLGGDLSGTTAAATVSKLQTFTLDLTGLTTNDIIRYDGTKLARSTAPLGVQFVEGSPSPRIRTTASLAIDTSGRFAQQIGADTYFFVSGSIGSKGTSTLGVATFGGDVSISGNLSVNRTMSVDTNGRTAQQVGSDNYFFVSGSINSKGTSTAGTANFGGDVNVSGNLFVGNNNGIELVGTTPVYVAIVGGTNHKITASLQSVIAGGTNNTIRNNNDVFIGGGDSNIVGLSTEGAIIGGISGIVSESNYGGIFVGDNNRVSSSNSSTVIGGATNTVIASTRSSIVGGISNVISRSNNSIILAGNSNVISGTGTTATQYNSILGGDSNRISAGITSGSIILGGVNNTITGATTTHTAHGSVVGGVRNTAFAKSAEANFLSVLSGESNRIFSAGSGSLIVGGTSNTISGSSTFADTNILNVIVGGRLNAITGTLNDIGVLRFNFIGSGLNNSISNVSFASIIGGRDNVITTSLYSDFTAIGQFIGGGRGNRIIGSTTSGSLIVGGTFNTISGAEGVNTRGQVIGGGEFNQILSLAASPWNTIAGGSGSLIRNQNNSTIGGGENNVINFDSAASTNGRHFIGGGSGNSIILTSSGSVIVGGIQNQISGNAADASAISFIGSGLQNAIISTLVPSAFNVIAGGFSNDILNGNASFIGGGRDHFISGSTIVSSSAIVGGTSNRINTVNSAFVGGGQDNLIDSTVFTAGLSLGQFIGGGRGNRIIGSTTSGSLIVGGTTNLISASADNNAVNVIVGGRLNTISSSLTTTGNLRNNFIGSGLSNSIVAASFASIIGGQNNTITASAYSDSDTIGQFIGGGRGNQIIGDLTSGSLIVGGTQNIISGAAGVTAKSQVIGGGEFNQILSPSNNSYNTIAGGAGGYIRNQNYSTIGGGENNIINHDSSAAANGRHFIGGGSGNSIVLNGSGSVIVGGQDNNISGSTVSTSRSALSFIGGGQKNVILSDVTTRRYNSIVGGSSNNIINSGESFIGGGSGQIISASSGFTSLNNVIVGGQNNIISGALKTFQHNFIGGGTGNGIADGEQCFIGSGGTNRAIGGNYSVIVGGRSNQISGSTALTFDDNVIGGGLNNRIRNTGTTVQMVRNTIAGGDGNVIESSTVESSYNSIPGGIGNTITNSSRTTIVGSGKSVSAVTGPAIFIAGGAHYNVLTGETLTATYTPAVDSFYIEYTISAPTVTLGTTNVAAGRVIVFYNSTASATGSINSNTMTVGASLVMLYTGTNWRRIAT